ncbi:MAG TPA: endonuclease/exonuclease/phosphatase family protein [Tepidisphaeraceae bacterium]|nr:endonuclease/exonuclease/phosphatase family protein [Tepidisphaeraceae bacterium]
MDPSDEAQGKSEDASQSTDDPKPPRRWVHWLRIAVVTACWLYLAMVLTFWLVMYFGTDRWWVATALMFGPRWVLATPLLLLIPAALAFHWRSLAILGIAAVIVLLPVMGFRIPWRPAFQQNAAELRLRLVTCNIHRYWLSGTGLRDLITTTQADVVALQEWTSRHESAAFGDAQWHTLRDDELFLASRYPIRKFKDLVLTQKDSGIAVCYELQTPTEPVYLINLHLMSPHPALESLIERDPAAPARIEQNSSRRREESRLISEFAAKLPGPVLLAGDFNTPTDSTIYRECWSQFGNAFCTAGTGFGFTYYTRLMRTRIDHILTGPGWQCRRSWVGPAIGSPHRPVIAELHHTPP